MVVSRISSYAVFQNSQQNVNSIQKRMFDLQDQISSGLKTRFFEGLQGDVEQLTFLENNVKTSKTYEANNSVAISQLQTLNVSISQLVEYADDIEDLTTLRRNGAIGESINFELQMDQLRQAVISELNSTFQGKFLFGGTETARPPVQENYQPSPLPAGQLSTHYYQGSTEDPLHRARENVVLNLNVRADNVAFQKLFAGMDLALKGSAETDDDQVAAGLDLIQESQRELEAIQANVNSNTINLQNINDRLESLRLQFQGRAQELTRTDVLTASTELANNEAQLSASFLAFSRLNQLRLTDFLG